MQRLGKNQGRYYGEGIDIKAVIAQLETAAEGHGWKSEVFLKADSYKLIGLHRTVPHANRRFYISAGIHGDEPAGPLAVLQLIQENRWPARADICLCPCLNPTGFPLNSRENAQGLDLNRQYLDPQAEETKAHMAWLERQAAFDVSMCLHEDWEAHGFYVYELNPHDGPACAELIVQRVAEVCPIDQSLIIEGRDASNGIIRPNADPVTRPQWPEAFYLHMNRKCELVYTMEAPSDFQLVTRVAALVNSVRAVLDWSTA